LLSYRVSQNPNKKYTLKTWYAIPEYPLCNSDLKLKGGLPVAVRYTNFSSFKILYAIRESKLCNSGITHLYPCTQHPTPIDLPKTNFQPKAQMKSLAASLKAEVDKRLALIQAENSNQVKAAQEAIKLLISSLEKLKTACLQYNFESKSEEIEFFRNTKPQLACLLIYYNEIYTIESNKPFGSKKTLRKYYNKELLKLEKFFRENLEFYRYYRRGNNSLDKKYFLRGKYDIQVSLDSSYFQADHRFSTSHDYKVAQILANEKIKGYLEAEMAKLENNESQSQKNTTKFPKWTGSKVALTELLFALHTEGVFNNGKAELKELASFFEAVFQVDLGQFHKTFLEIRERKSERTKFLNALKENLIIRMEQADEN